MRIVKQTTANKFINLHEIKDPDNHVNGYQYAERRGVNSVAFICFDKNIGQVLLNYEYKPPVNKFILGAFGGSFDKDKTGVEIVIDEVKEEAGFVVTTKDIELVGKSFVSTQMNQYCYLYVVSVCKEDQQDREPENEIEAMAVTKWLETFQLKAINDWKAITILAKSDIQ